MVHLCPWLVSGSFFHLSWLNESLFWYSVFFKSVLTSRIFLGESGCHGADIFVEDQMQKKGGNTKSTDESKEHNFFFFTFPFDSELEYEF